MRVGKIYKIIHNQSNLCYVGSTFGPLASRWNSHSQKFKAFDKGLKTDCISIYPYFKRYGIENFKIILIKEYDIIDRRHLEVYESLWISKLKACNKNNPIDLPLKKQYMKNYVEEHKDHLKEIGRIYREKNKEVINAKRQQKIECACGTTYSNNDKARHERCARHKKYLENGTITKYKRTVFRAA